MATEGLMIAGSNAAFGVLMGDVRHVSEFLIKLASAARTSKSKCKAMAEDVKELTIMLEKREKRQSLITHDSDLQANVEKLRVVLGDCVSLVKKCSSRRFYFSALWRNARAVDEFVDLEGRLKRCIDNLNLDVTLSLHDQMEQNTAQHQNSEALLLEIKQLIKGPEEQRPQDVPAVKGDMTVGEALAGDYMISGMLTRSTGSSSETPQKVILVQSHETQREVMILGKLSLHECMLEFLGIFQYGVQRYLVFERPSEEMTTLDEVISKNPGGFMRDWRVKRQIAMELARGMKDCHLAGVVHKNFRSPNVFLTDDLQHIKIFGFYQGRVTLEPSAKKWMNDEQVRWAAPEQVQRRRPSFDEKCDIYSLGVVLWELITGKFPFASYTNYRQLTRDRSQNMAALDDFSAECRTGEIGKFSKISELCRDPLPDNRPSLDKVIGDLSVLLPEEMI